MVNADTLEIPHPATARRDVVCRPIGVDDIEAVVTLLCRGFPERDRRYWQRALQRLRDRDLPADAQRFGYMLDARGRCVGVLLLIFSTSDDATPALRCNVSSWYVDPDFRGFAPLLVLAAVKRKQVTYLNASPARHTWPILDAQGYRRYAERQMFALPALSWPEKDVTVHAIAPDATPCPGLDDATMALLRRHAGYGCLSFVCATAQGDAAPFVFVRRRTLRRLIPTAELIYCRSLDELVHFAGNLGRALLLRGIPTMVFDSDDRPSGLVGRVVVGRAPKYFRGPVPPRLGDLADTESALFGP